MKPKPLAIFFLACSAIVFSFTICLIGQSIPSIFEVCFGVKADDLQYFMPLPTRFASENTWVFCVAFLLIWMVTLALLRRASEGILQVLIAGFCLQCGIVWIAMFCFFYDGFLGPMSLHHQSQFEFIELVRFERGIFPIAFLSITAPLIFSLHSVAKSKGDRKG